MKSKQKNYRHKYVYFKASEWPKVLTKLGKEPNGRDIAMAYLEKIKVPFDK